MSAVTKCQFSILMEFLELFLIQVSIQYMATSVISLPGQLWFQVFKRLIPIQIQFNMSKPKMPTAAAAAAAALALILGTRTISASETWA